MLHTIWGPGMELREEELLRREQRNRKYMMDLKSENLLLNYNLEAGRYTAAFFPRGHPRRLGGPDLPAAGPLFGPLALPRRP